MTEINKIKNHKN
jgi:hypothetical protein